MADILHYYNLNQASSSCKSSRKSRGDGFKAPRNSIDFAAAAVSHMHHVFDENVPYLPASKNQYSCQVLHRQRKVSYIHRRTTMKKLIDDEMSNRANERRDPPSVVARLMGMDPTPAKNNSNARSKEIEVRKAVKVTARKHTVNGSSAHPQAKCSLLPYGSKRDSGRNRSVGSRPTLREHPQEALLQKFKKDFEEWQASSVLKSSKAHLAERSVNKGKYTQILAQEHLNREKMARYVDPKRRNSAQKKLLEPPTEDVSAARLKFEAREREESKFERRAGAKIVGSSKSNVDFVAKVGDENERHCSPTRIMILKPSFERRVGSRESWDGSTETNADCGMEEFLEEVKRKINYEVQEKYRSNARKRESRNDTLFRERPADPKQIAREIAKHIRESVTRDVGKKLTRSESTRSYGSDFKRGTRRILEARMKNVLKSETELEDETSAPTKNEGRAKSLSDFSNIGWEDKKITTEFFSRRKRDVEWSDSSRNLLRSFSAPVPGSAFGNLLLEDQHILTGAHIRRKHELSDRTSREAKKNRRESFSLKGRVLNLRENFKLFGKKPNSSRKPAATDCNSLKVIRTIPSAIVKCGIAKDNATEVPPSPASITSSSHNESRTPDNPSPVSPLEVQLTDSQPSQSFVEDLNFDLPELNEELEQVDNGEVEESTTKEETETKTETKTDNLYEMFEVKSDDEAYIRGILIAAGFYEDKSPRSGAPTSPIIPYRVFEEVEGAYTRLAKMENEDSFVGHKMLFDLVNEALQIVIDNTRNNSSTLLRWILEKALVLRSKKLLSDLSGQIRVFKDLPMDEMRTIDGVTVRDTKLAPRNNKFYEDIESSGKKIEFAIFGDLIDEFVQEMHFECAVNELHGLQRSNFGL